MHTHPVSRHSRLIGKGKQEIYLYPPAKRRMQQRLLNRPVMAERQWLGAYRSAHQKAAPTSFRLSRKCLQTL